MLIQHYKIKYIKTTQKQNPNLKSQTMFAWFQGFDAAQLMKDVADLREIVKTHEKKIAALEDQVNQSQASNNE